MKDEEKIEFDDEFEPDNGVYAVPGRFWTKVRALFSYLNATGKTVDDLTPDEWEKFIVKKKNWYYDD